MTHDLLVADADVSMTLGERYTAMCRVLTDYHRVALTVTPAELSAKAAEDGVAVLTAALRRVMTEPGFRERVTKLSRRLKAHKRTPVEQVITLRNCHERYAQVSKSRILSC